MSRAFKNKVESFQMHDDQNEKKTTTINGRLNLFLVVSLIVAAFGSFQMGFNVVLLNIPQPIIEQFYNITYFERNNVYIPSDVFLLLVSFIGGSFTIGGAVGGLSSGFIADTLGRKKGLIITNAYVIIAAILMIVAKFIKSYESLLIGRFLAGVASGTFTGIVPLYIFEITPSNLRGKIGTLQQLFICFGIVFSSILGLPEVLGKLDLWPVLVGFVLLQVFIHIALFFMVETPKFLYNKDKIEDASIALIKLRGANAKDLVDNELNELENESQLLKNDKKVNWFDLFRVHYFRRPLIVVLIIHLGQQLSGINAVMIYSSDIFKNILEPPLPNYVTIAIGAVQLLMTFVCMAVIDKYGRKLLLLVGMIGMCVCCVVLAISILIKTEDWLKYLAIAAVIVYIVFFSLGPGPIPWLITNELFGSEARGKASSIAVLTNWSANVVVSFLFPVLDNLIGAYTFLIFAVLLILFAAGILFLAPETKGKSNEQLKELFKDQLIFLKSH